MTTRLPNRRYIGDGVYAGHDGESLVLETCDGHTVKNRIVLDRTTMTGMNQYKEYVREFYRTGQHLVPPECEGCGADIRNFDSPVPGILSAEIYQVEYSETRHEIRLCRDCARTVDQDFLVQLVGKRGQGTVET